MPALSRLTRFQERMALRDCFKFADYRNICANPLVTCASELICAFGERHGDFELASTGAGNLEIPDALHEFSQEATRLIEALLASMLRDAAKREGMSGTWNGKSFVDPRVCDIAGHVLSIRYKGKYDFDFSASLPERDRQLVTLQNIWREENNLELLPLPEPRTNTGLPQAKVQPFFDLILSDATSSRRQEAIGQLELLGLAALPAVRHFSESLPKDHPASADVSSLSSRLANTVVEILVERGSVTPNDVLRGKLDALMNRPLTTARFVGILRDTISNLPEGATGISLTAHRSNDSTGVRLAVGLSKDFAHQPGTQKGWSFHERVRIGAKDIHNPSGILGYEYAFTGEAYERLSRAIHKALETLPSEPFLINASLKMEK